MVTVTNSSDSDSNTDFKVLGRKLLKEAIDDLLDKYVNCDFEEMDKKYINLLEGIASNHIENYYTIFKFKI